MYGHGVFIYNPNEALEKYETWDGVAAAIADMKMGHAWIRGHGKDGLYYPDQNRHLIDALRRMGLVVFVWGWCHGGNNVDEDLENVSRSLATFKPDGYVADIEHGVAGAIWSTTTIKRFLGEVREAVEGKPLILSTFGFIPYHEPNLMKAADPYVDAFAPQVYWFWFPKQAMFNQPGATGTYQENNAAAYTNLCIDVWRHITRKPLIVTGQAYWKESPGWTQHFAERKLHEFVDGFTRFNDIVGLNWWHLAGDAAMSSKMAETIRDADFASKVPLEPRVAPPRPRARRLPEVRVGTAATPSAASVAYVKTEGLNLRTEPNGQIIRSLTIGDKVEVLGNAADPRWKLVKVGVEKGVVFGAYLRDPVAPEIERLLEEALGQWVRFDKGRANEKSDPYYKYVGEMWRSIGFDYDGRSTYPNGEDVPWSAAFISFVVRKAGPYYATFDFSDAHSEFSHGAIQARILGWTDKPFWGYRLSEMKPTLGDIVHRNRGSGNFSFDYAENHSRFNSHSDVVIEVRDRIIRVVGGNVSDTVSMTGNVQEYDLDAKGHLKPGQKIIALLKNRAAEVVV